MFDVSPFLLQLYRVKFRVYDGRWDSRKEALRASTEVPLILLLFTLYR